MGMIARIRERRRRRRESCDPKGFCSQTCDGGDCNEVLNDLQAEVTALRAEFTGLLGGYIKNNAKVQLVNERAQATAGRDPAYLYSASHSHAGTGWSHSDGIRWNIQKI